MATLRARLSSSSATTLAAIVVTLAGSFVTGCAATKPAPVKTAAPPVVESGFLSDYSRLQPSDQFPALRIWRAPELGKGFRKICFRPVEVWRGADRQLEDIPQQDLQALADRFYRAMVTKLGSNFQLVEQPGPGVLEIQLALTWITAEKQKMDMLSTTVPVEGLAARSGTMSEATQRFVHDCALEAEFSETPAQPAAAAKDKAVATTKRRHSKRVMKAAMFDARRGKDTPKSDVQTWEELDAVFAKWAGLVDEQLVALREGTFHPKFTTGGGATK